MSPAKYLVGDVFDQLATLEPGSVDLILTSPPFLALRSYLPADHPDKAQEIGSEATPGAYIDRLLDWVEACDRVLAPHGSLCVELGDTYSGSGGAGGDYDADGLRAGQPAYKGSAARKENRVVLADGRTIQSAGISNGQLRKGDGWPLDKSLCLIPESFRWALTYGHNPHTGRQTRQWRTRNVVRFCRPNPTVGSLGDKWRPATSELLVACKSRTRYFDLDSCRSNAAWPTFGTVPSVAGAPEVMTTLLADHDAAPRGWCDLGESKVTLGSSVTWETHRLQVVEPIGLLVGVETLEGPQVMDLQGLGRPADPALVTIAVERFLANPCPVATAVAGSATIPTGIVLASDINAAPFAGTLEAAKIVCQDLALVAGQWLAARITLHCDEACLTAFAIAPIARSDHAGESSSKYDSNGAPPLDWWSIPTEPYKHSHYATWPSALCVKPILTMAPERVCRTCGQPSRRLTTVEYVDAPHRPLRSDEARRYGSIDGKRHNDHRATSHPLVGWSDCGHDNNWRKGVVLDPFAGSGTTLAVAEKLGRDSIGIDLDESNVALAQDRVARVGTLTTTQPDSPDITVGQGSLLDGIA